MTPCSFGGTYCLHFHSIRSPANDAGNFSETMYRVSTKSFPCYKYLLQENYVEYNRNITINTRHKILETNLSNGKKYVCIPRSFLVINVRNQGKTLCSLCIVKIWTMSFEKTEMPKSSTVREIRTRGMTQTVSLF